MPTSSTACGAGCNPKFAVQTFTRLWLLHAFGTPHASLCKSKCAHQNTKANVTLHSTTLSFEQRWEVCKKLQKRDWNHMPYFHSRDAWWHTELVIIPAVPHKAAAEVSKIGHYRRGEWLRCMDRKANPLMDRKVWLELCFFFGSGCNGCSGRLTHNCWM